MREMLRNRQKELVRSDVLALGHNTQELTRVMRQIEKKCAYVYHGFTFFDDDRMRARNRSFEVSFAKLDKILHRLEKHVLAIERYAG